MTMPFSGLKVLSAEGVTLHVAGLAIDSRAVEPGFLFIAVPGARVDGAAFIPQALDRGATAILTAPGVTGVPEGITHIESADPRRLGALLAASFYGAQPETVVAVTGTSGKTSVANFARQIFEKAGHSAAALGTLGLTLKDGTREGSLTTPDPVALQAFLAELAADGITHLAMEASSHGLDQRRLDGVRLTAGGFTNLGRDHLDYHADMETYFLAKMRLFEALLPEGAPAAIWSDDIHGMRAVDLVRRSGRPVMSVGTEEAADLHLSVLKADAGGQTLELLHKGVARTVHLPLVGSFQASNAVLAAALCHLAGVPLETALAALETLGGVPGRLERIGATARGGAVFVDYAHKPEAVVNVLEALRPFTRRRLSIVIGAGGDRDAGKRPLMGEAALRLADRVIVTDDNPRSEDPADIRRQVLAGAPGAEEIGDRRFAIQKAVFDLQDGDILVIAGKGHETGQTINGVKHPFDDREEARKAIAACRA